MALRLVEAVLPRAAAAELMQLADKQEVLGVWEDPFSEDRTVVRILLTTAQSEEVMDLLEERFAHTEGFRTMLFAVEATLPRPEKPKKDDKAESAEAENAKRKAKRISREELYNDVADGARPSPVYFLTIVLSTVVAAIGLLRDDVAVIIGAMVIAPLLGPNVSLALGTALGDLDLVRRSLRTNLAGLALALALSVGIGAALPVDETANAISSRTRVDLADVALALAAGSAGALAFTQGVPAALIGVMVAVALLPPAVVVGLLAGEGRFGPASQAGLLVLTNVICVNIAGVATFTLQGIRPRQWWEADRARRATRRALLLWAVALIVLVAAMSLAR